MTDISLVIPTMNEEEGIGECIDRAQNAFEELGMDGEIIISDSSSDKTAEIAREKGAKVVTPDKPGYGYAYRYGFSKAEGDLIAMGDGDTTYDFEDLPDLVEKMREEDADMVMGSRLEGNIKPGSMPKLHKYIGNPLLTKFLNNFYGAGVSDAHSGMRVIKKESLDELDLKTDGMEFASEMIMEAGARDLKIVEKPIVYHEREGEATLNSFRDGWRHVKFMLLNAPDYLFSIPGLVFMIIGLSLLGFGMLEYRPLGIKFGHNSMIAGSLLTIVGYQGLSLSVFSSYINDTVRKSEGVIEQTVRRNFSLERGLLTGLSLSVISGFSALLIIQRWFSSGFEFVPSINQSMAPFIGLVLGIQTVFYSFFMHLAKEKQ